MRSGLWGTSKAVAFHWWDTNTLQLLTAHHLHHYKGQAAALHDAKRMAEVAPLLFFRKPAVWFSWCPYRVCLKQLSSQLAREQTGFCPIFPLFSNVRKRSEHLLLHNILISLIFPQFPTLIQGTTRTWSQPLLWHHKITPAISACHLTWWGEQKMPFISTLLPEDNKDKNCLLLP